ncbi:hypothetical protein LCGC14_2599150, partial [marine sediment metagenome]
VDDPASAPSRVFEERQQIATDRPPPQGGAETAGRLVGTLLTAGVSETPLSSAELVDEPLITALIAVPGGAAIGSPAAAAASPFARAAFADSRTAIGQYLRQLGRNKADLAFEGARITPRASDFAAITRTVDDVARGKPNTTRDMGTPVLTDPGTGELREIQLF